MSAPDLIITPPDAFPPIDRRFVLEKLIDDGKRNTYGAWVGVAKSKLQLLNLWKYIAGPESEPPVVPKLVADARFQATEESSGTVKWFIQKGNEEEVDEARKKAEPWARGNLAARTILLEALTAEKRSLISEDESAKQIWTFLAQEYRPLNFTRAQVQFQDIMKFTCKPRMDVSKWADQLRRMYVELREHSPDRIKDTDFAVTIANLLPATPAWSDFGGRLFESLSKAEDDGSPMSSSTVFSMIKQHDWNQKKNDPDAIAEAYNTEALYTKRPGSPSINQSASPAKKAVDYCGNTKCPRRRGHRTENCLAWGGAKCGQYPENWRGRTDLHLPPEQREKEGTFKNKSKTFTTHANAATQDGSASDSASQNAADEAQVTAALCQEGEYYTFHLMSAPDPTSSVTCNTTALVPNNPRAVDEVYHDSGANRHIFHNQSVFSNYRPISPVMIKGFGSSLSTSAVGVGDVHLIATVHGIMSTVKLSDVLHVPSARLNLVSQGCLQRRGVDCVMKGGLVTLSSNGKTIITGRIQANDLYRLHVRPVSRNLGSRLAAHHASLADRISTPLIDRISPPFANGASGSRPRKSHVVSEGFYTA